jgi:hypothetical protein
MEVAKKPQTWRDPHFPRAAATTVPSLVLPSRFRTKPRALTYDWTKNRGQIKRTVPNRISLQ